MFFALCTFLVGALVGLCAGLYLRRERAREKPEQLLLRLLSEHTPIALLLYADDGQIRFANHLAEELLFAGQNLANENLLHLLNSAAPEVRKAMLAQGDSLFSLEHEGEVQSFQMLRRHLTLEGQAHVLLLVNPLTRELARREVTVLKKVIRVISHELNNSLASISSLLNSAQIILRKPDHLQRLEKVFAGLDERTNHLKNFLGRYAQLARLPQPHPTTVEWEPFLTRMKQLYPKAAYTEPPEAPGWFDEAQMEQVMINLLKNAYEAGGNTEDIEVLARHVDGELHLGVLDRGEGFSDEALSQGLLPFYSTKPEGSGMGLALCREIAEAHGGTLRLKRREGGGSAVYCVLPLQQEPPSSTTSYSALRLTRT